VPPIGVHRRSCDRTCHREMSRKLPLSHAAQTPTTATWASFRLSICPPSTVRPHLRAGRSRATLRPGPSEGWPCYTLSQPLVGRLAPIMPVTPLSRESSRRQLALLPVKERLLSPRRPTARSESPAQRRAAADIPREGLTCVASAPYTAAVLRGAARIGSSASGYSRLEAPCSYLRRFCNAAPMLGSQMVEGPCG